MGNRATFGITIPSDLRQSLERLAKLKGTTLNGLIRSALEALAAEHDGLRALDGIRAEALAQAFAAHEAEWRAAEALVQTLRGRLESARALLDGNEKEARDIQHRLLSPEDLAPDGAAALRMRLQEINAENATLRDLVRDYETALKDAENRLKDVERAIADRYRALFEARAWPLLESELARISDRLRTFYNWALDLIGETRDTSGARGLKACRFLEMRQMALLMANAHPALAAYAQRNLFTDGPRSPEWLARVLGTDLPPRHLTRLRPTPEGEDESADLLSANTPH